MSDTTEKTGKFEHMVNVEEEAMRRLCPTLQKTRPGVDWGNIAKEIAQGQRKMAQTLDREVADLHRKFPQTSS